MEEAFVVAAVRTAIGRRNGRLSGMHPVDLGAAVVDELLDRSGVPVNAVDDLLFGCVSQIGAQGGNLARNVVLSSRLDVSVPGVTVDRQCGSSLQAIQFGAQAVMSGTQDLVICGGVECMSQIPLGANVQPALGFGVPGGERLEERYPGIVFSQFEGAEALARKYHLARDELDHYALRSHDRAARAIQLGRFGLEIMPVELTLPDGRVITHDTDEGVRLDASYHALAGLNSLLPGGRLTAGSASQISDGAAALMIANRRAVESLDLTVVARVHSMVAVGSDPQVMLEGPIPATEKLLLNADLSLDDIDLYEVNEAFASVPLAWLRALDADMERLNVNGGAMALGHPLGATGVRLVTSLLYELARRDGRYGLVAICEGGGMANAMLLERIDF